MAEEQSVASLDKLNDSLIAEDWTIIDKRDSKGEITLDANVNSAEQKETSHDDELNNEDEIDSRSQEDEDELERKENEDSDDVSVITDESDAEKVCLDIKQIEDYDMELQNEKAPAIQAYKKSERRKRLQKENSTSNVIIVCSVVALLLGLFTGQILELQSSRQPTTNNNALEDQLKELSKVKQELEEIRATMSLRKEPQNTQEPRLPYNQNMFKQKDNFGKLLFVRELVQMSIFSFQNQKIMDMLNEFDFKGDKLSVMFFVRLKNYINKFKDNSSMEKKRLENMDEKISMLSEELMVKLTSMLLQFSNSMRENLMKLAINICSSSREESVVNKEINEYCSTLMGNFPNFFDNRSKGQLPEVQERISVDEEVASPVENAENTNFVEVLKDDSFTERLEKAKRSLQEAFQRPLKRKGEAKQEKNWKEEKFETKKKLRNVTNDKAKCENGKNLKNNDTKKNENKKRKFRNSEEKVLWENGHDNKLEIDDIAKKSEKKRAKVNNDEKFDKKRNVEYVDNCSTSDSGEWQLQRGKAREKLRKDSDWYFIRADSRFQARVEKDTKSDFQDVEEEPELRKPPRKENFKKRLLKKVGKAWSFLKNGDWRRANDAE